MNLFIIYVSCLLLHYIETIQIHFYLEFSHYVNYFKTGPSLDQLDDEIKFVEKRFNPDYWGASGDVNFGDYVQIHFTKNNSQNLDLGRNISLNGYVWNFQKFMASDWIIRNKTSSFQNKSYSSELITFTSSGYSFDIYFQIPNRDKFFLDFTGLTPIQEYVCNPFTLTTTYGNNELIKFHNYITGNNYVDYFFSDFTDKELIYLELPSIGHLKQNDSIITEHVVQASNIYYQPGTNNGFAYIETMEFYAYKNDPNIQKNCQQRLVTFKVCGENCLTCDESTNPVTPYICTKCQPDYTFLEDEKRKCVHNSTFDDSYYTDSLGIIRKCYSTCAKCSKEYEVIDGKEQHNCQLCKDNTYFIQTGTDQLNCFNEIGDYYQNGDTKELIESCPDGKYVDEDAKKCVDDCNTGYTVKDSNKCVSSCKEIGYYILNNVDTIKVCVSDCIAEGKMYYMVDPTNGERICKDQCPNDRYININECVTACPPVRPYIFPETKECLVNCNERTDTIHNEDTNICVKECDSDTQYYNSDGNKCVSDCTGKNTYKDETTKTCVSQCDYAFIDDDVCVSQCPRGTYKDIAMNNFCVSTCSSLYPFINGIETECVKVCDEPGYLLIGFSPLRCVNNCTYNDKLTAGNKCVDECDVSYPFHYENGKVCLRSCEEQNLYQVNRLNKCVQECDDTEYKYIIYEDGENTLVTKKCVTECRGELPYEEPVLKKCVSECIHDNRTLIYPDPLSCVDECYGDYPLKEGHECKNSCTLGKYIMNNECVDDCPDNYMIDDITCVAVCPTERDHIINNHCSSSCNTYYSYYYPSNKHCYLQCHSAPSSPIYTIESTLTCVNTCASPYNYILLSTNENYCIDNCTSITSSYGTPMYISSNSVNCVNGCEDYEYISNSIHCVSTCPNYYDIDTKQCVLSCSSSQFIKRSTNACYNLCPTNHFILFTNGVGECIDSACPSSHPYTYNNECIRNCSDINLYTYNTKCITELECEHYIEPIGKTCNDVCNGDYPYINMLTHQCVSTCPSGMYVTSNNECVNECPEHLPYHLHDTKECVDNCKHYNYNHISSSNNACVPQCAPNEKYAIDNVMTYCLTACAFPYSFQLGNSNECVTQCNGEYPYEDGMKCVKECSNNKYIQGNKCVSTCINAFIVDGSNECVNACPIDVPFYSNSFTKCVTHCEALNDKYYTHNNKRICTHTCPSNTPYSLVSTGECVSTCPNDAKYIDDLFKQCIPSCYSSVPYLDTTTNTCVTVCDIAKTYLIVDQRICVSQCDSDNGYYTVPALHQCVRECDVNSDYYYVDSEHKECLDNCKHAKDGYNLHYKHTCVNVCPDFTKAYNNVCKFDLEFIDQTEDFLITAMPKDEIISDLEQVLDELTQLNQTIKGDDFILQVYPSHTPLTNNSYTSSLNFSECELLLIQHGIIDKGDTLIIVKFDYINETAITNQVEYKAYTTNGRNVDISICKDVYVNINYPLYNEEDMHYSLGYTMNEEYGVDIYNASSLFYNEFCLPFQYNDVDVLLEQRRMSFYMNISLCPSECEFIRVNYVNKVAECKCKTKILFSETASQIHQNVLDVDKEFLKVHTPINVYVVKCYMLFKDAKGLVDNISFWFSGLLMVVMVVAGVLIVVVEKEKVYKRIFNVIQSHSHHPPRRNVNAQLGDNNSNTNSNSNLNDMLYNNNELRYGKEKKYLDNDDDNNIFIMSANDNNSNNSSNNVNDNQSYLSDMNSNNNSNTYGGINSFSYENSLSKDISAKRLVPVFNDINKGTLHIMSNNNNDNDNYDYTYNNTYSFRQDTEAYKEFFTFYPLIKQRKVDQSPFVMAVEFDKRSFCQIYCTYLKDEILFLKLFYPSTQFDLIAVQILNYITYYNLIALCNTLLYFNTYIQYRYDNNGKYHLTKTYVNATVSYVFAIIILHIINRATAYKQIMETMLTEVKIKKEMEKLGHYAIKHFVKKVIIYYIIVAVIMMFSWYYLILFNCLYKASQIDWFVCCVVSLTLEVVVNMAYVLVVTVLRKGALIKGWRTMYNVSLYLKELAYYY